MKAFLNKFRFLTVVEAFCILLLLPGCFRQEQLVYSARGNELQPDVSAKAPEGISFFNGEELVLRPGIYRVNIEARLSEGDSLYLTVRDDDSLHQTLCCNGVTMTAQKSSTGFEVFVTDVLDSAYLHCELQSLGGAEEALTEDMLSLELHRTGKGGRVLMFCVVAAIIVLNLLLYFREGILKGSVSGQQQTVFWLLAAGTAIACFPYLTDYFSLNPVNLSFLFKIEEGHPLFLIPAALRRIGFSIMTSYKMYVFAAAVLAAAGMYWLCKKCCQDRYAAAMGSLLYLLSPLRLAYIYEGRGSFLICVLTGAAGALLLSFLMAGIKRRQSGREEKSRGVQIFQAAYLLLFLLILGRAVWQVNQLAFESSAVWLYNIENIG